MPTLFSPTIGARSRQGIGSCGCAVLPAARPRPSICGPSIAIRGPRLAASSQPCRAVPVGRTRRSRSSSASPTKASPTNCTSNTLVGCWATEQQMQCRRARATKPMAVSACVTAFHSSVTTSRLGVRRYSFALRRFSFLCNGVTAWRNDVSAKRTDTISRLEHVSFVVGLGRPDLRLGGSIRVREGGQPASGRNAAAST